MWGNEIMTLLRTALGCVIRFSRPCISPVQKQLVVFPHAGGGVAFYQHWRDLLPDDVDLFIVLYPGREDAQSLVAWETAQHAVEHCTNSLQSLLGIAPVVFFGHSMGALLALRVAGALQKSRFAINTVLSAQRIPSELIIYKREEQRQEILDSILTFSEGSSVLMLDEFTRPVVTRLIWQDLRLLGELSDGPLPNLLPRIWGGERDPLISSADLLLWEKALPGCRVRFFPGDHFYFMQDTAAFLRLLLQ